MKIETVTIENTIGKTFDVNLIKQEEPVKKVAVFFPGVGYTTKFPLFYYSTALFREKGYDVLHVNYDFRSKEYETLTNEEYANCIKEDTKKAVDVSLSNHSYEEFVVLGKSIGTMAMSYEMDTREWFSDAKAIWLTPLIHNNFVFEKMSTCTQNSLSVIGSADFAYKEDRWNEIGQLSNYQTLLLEGADHSLEIKSDLEQSLDLMKQTIQAIEKFIG
ncbi:hypothetical protein GCM10008967_03240 [Bacillus carboniphilus]|uniref:Alpha/beta hydrolase n=1 Tax=Bacillus carboniphilus TaxID=86663 RepID=A0ABN0VS98_9BACI